MPDRGGDVMRRRARGRRTALSRRRLAVFTAALIVAGCGDGGSGPPPTPAALVATSPNPLAASVVGAAVSPVPEFEVRSSSGRAIGGVPVTVSVTGGGTLTGAPTVSLPGPTPIGTWVLGESAGPQSVTVTVAELAPLEFTVQAQAAAPAELQVVSGHNQFGVAETAAAVPLRVRVVDAFGNPVAGAAVAWSVAAGGGTIAGASSTTDAEGIATAPSWTFGADDGGEEAVVATVGSLTARFVALIGAVPASIVIETPPPERAPVGEPIATVPTFSVRTADDVPISGFPVEVTVSAGGGAIAGAPTTTATGATPIGEWTLGTTIVEQRVSITVPGLAPTEVVVQAVAGPVDTLAIVSGDGQSAVAGAQLPAQPRVRVADRFGNPVEGATINWHVTEGGGSLSATTSFSFADGQASAPVWRLGRIISPQTLRAFVNFKTVFISAEIATNYSVDLRYVGEPPTTTIQQAFSNAARRIEAAVVGDESDVAINNDISACGIGGVGTVQETVDDVLIFANIDSIDGPGGTLGGAGPCLVRGSFLTAVGGMVFDESDLMQMAADGRLEEVILHEMLHVVGIGTLWSSVGLLADAGTSNVRFTGSGARQACVNDHAGGSVCSTAVPVENCRDLPDNATCGQGTEGSHWKESIFVTELMTGFINSGFNPFSKMSIESLGDVGYNVNPLAADPYTVPPTSPGLRAPGAAAIRLPEPMRPRYAVDAAGNVTPIPDR